MKDEIAAQIAETLKFGCVSSAGWQSYTWKNALEEQKRRIDQHLQEALADAKTEHNPYHMLERAIGVAALCMRRLIERHLVTDRFRESQLDVHEIRKKANAEWREPFVSRTADEIFNNYDMKSRRLQRKTPKFISDKMLHARVIGVLSGSEYLPDGLLIASDFQSKSNVFHFTQQELATLFDAFLLDEVRYMQDGYAINEDGVIGTSKVIAIRR